MARFTPYAFRGNASSMLEPTKETINGLEEAIRWAENEVPRNIPRAMNELVYMMAMVNQGIARKMSFGPSDPSGKDSDMAWKIPVRRISQRYYLGWKVRARGPGVWQLYNDSREAYFIEFGISRVGFGGERSVPEARIRRPIRKLSLRRTLDYMASTKAFHRIWADIYVHRGKSYGFTQVVQGGAGGHSIFSAWGTPSSGSGSFSGPMLGRRMPG